MDNLTENTVSADNQSFDVRGLRKASNAVSLALLVFIAFQFISALVPDMILKNFMDTETEFYENLIIFIQFVLQYFVGVTVSILVLRLTKSGKASEKTFSVFRKPQQPFWWVCRWIIITIALTYSAAIFTNLMISLFNTVTGIELNQVNLGMDDNSFSKITMAVSVALLAPVFEEILMRSAYLGGLRRFSTWAAAAATGLFFGLLHANVPQILFAAVMGFFSAYMVIKTKSIIPSLIVHFSVNTIGSLTMLLTAGMDLDKLRSGNIEGIEDQMFQIMLVGCVGLGIIALIGTGVVLFILELTVFRKNLKPEPVHSEVSEAKKFGIIMTAPVTILLTLLLVFLTVLNAWPAE